MTKPNGKRLKLSEMRERRAKALGGRYAELEDDDGNVIEIPRMAFWDAETYEEYVQEHGFRTDLATLELMMPPEDFARLKKLKLELGDVADIVAEVTKDGRSPESQGSSMR